MGIAYMYICAPEAWFDSQIVSGFLVWNIYKMYMLA